MPGHLGPPPDVRRPAPPQDRPTDDLTDTAHPTVSAAVRLSRRGRVELLCGHRADPFVGCLRCEPVSDVQAEAAVDALETLDRHGVPGLADTPTCRALWRIGRRDLALAVHRRTSGGVCAPRG